MGKAVSKKRRRSLMCCGLGVSSIERSQQTEKAHPVTPGYELGPGDKPGSFLESQGEREGGEVMEIREVGRELLRALKVVSSILKCIVFDNTFDLTGSQWRS